MGARRGGQHYSANDDKLVFRSLRLLFRLGIVVFFAQSAFHIYAASLPLYFSGLGFDETLIGLLVGAAGVAELLGALMVGPAIDRFGARALLLAGAGCYLLAAIGFLVFQAAPLLAMMRLVCGFGLAAVVPSAYSFVPHLAPARSQTVAFASLGAAGNAAAAIFPLLGLTLLLQVGPPSLFVAAAATALVALLVTLTVPGVAPGRRALSLVFRRAWLMPLAVAILTVLQWGVIQAFVPLEAERAGSNPALLFTTDAICVLAARIPAGWIADRYGPFRLAALGVVMMALSPAVLLLPLNQAVLILAGALNGGGAGLTLPPMLAQISQRSEASTRGTGLAFFSVAFAIGMILGAAGGGLLYPLLRFHGLLTVGAILCSVALVALVRDRATMAQVARVAAAAAG